MHVLILVPKISGQQITLFYTTKEAIEGAHSNVHEFQKGNIGVNVLKAKDDFGHIVTIERDNLSHAIVIDPERAAQLGPPTGQGQRIPQNGPVPGVRTAPINPDTELTA